ncbi:MAG: GNAT family N-acetyltransferase [Paracoccaceae bacterium]
MTPERIALRSAVPDDLDALAQLWCDGWQIGHRDVVPDSLARLRTLPSFRARLEAGPGDVLTSGPIGRPTCFVMLKDAEIDQFYVAPRYVGSGLAADLMAATETALRDRGIARAHLICTEGNDRAMRFYQRHGWVEVSRGDAIVPGPFTLRVIRFEKSL